jgi:arginine:pyruvate transaminase
MQYSPLVKRIAGEGADAWLVHYAARLALERGEDVILLSVGDPDLETPAPILERAIERLRAGDNHYKEATGRQHVREAIAASHRRQTCQPADA